MQGNPYSRGLASLRAEIASLRRLLELLSRAEETLAGLEASWARPRRARGGRRSPANPGAPSWTQAIAQVLQDGRPRTVAEIAEELERSGRSFGPSSGPCSLVRSVLHRGAARYGWVASGRPRRWACRALE